ncbi:MAG: T9SS type A sorting domain-containing protein [Cyclobacteriaceae bacterium]|nr:T9SS type A sorting domain-containing protein [Cyclobacteriaceae bacterium]
MNRLVLSIFFLCTISSGFCQLIVVPIQKENSSKTSSTARTRSVDPITLPFWEDFSAARKGYADTIKWQYGNSVWINSGMGIDPPSYNVATFDGLDSLGKPYNVNDVLAKGFADKLISAPIRMDLPSASERLAIAITFFYQFQGNGEPPDAGDLLSLAFKNNLGVWEVVWSIENDGTLMKDKFIPVTIPITAGKYFHDNFQFRFQNFARLSGPYDTWHVDYIYIGNGKSQTSPVYPLFPDRAISKPFTSIFSTYSSMPIKHFYSAPAANFTKPSITITNRRQDQTTGNGQPVSYSSTAKITMIKEGQAPTILNSILDVNLNIGGELKFNDQRLVTLQTMPNPATFDATSDSIHIQLKIAFDTGDDKIKTPTEGDYDFNVFNPLIFKINDSLSASYILSDFYAYDDGAAEYGAGLNQPGAQVAYQFDMKTTEPDTIVAVDIYFPRFGDESNRIIQFQILRDLTDKASDVLYQGNLPIQRNSLNKFWRIPLVEEPIGVKGKFYIGWKQLASATIAVGLDKNTDSGDMIYTNINGAWEQNTSLKGSLMIRPVFGPGKGGVISGVDETIPISLYPNPSSGTFYISSLVDEVILLDTTGKRISINIESETDRTRISIQSPSPGLYLLRTYQNKVWKSSKVVVR